MTNQTASQFTMSPIDNLLSWSIESLKKLTKHAKTLSEVLEDNLTDDELKRIYKYITVSESTKECSSIRQALCVFRWSETMEGREYWAKVYSRFED